MLISLDHLVIAVRDLTAATATYSRLLGRAPSWRGEHPGAGTANTLFRLDRTYAELLSPVGPGPLGDAVRMQRDMRRWWTQNRMRETRTSGLRGWANYFCLGPVSKAYLEREGEGPFALAFGTEDATACAAALRARGLSAIDPIEGRGRDAATGAERAWRTVLLPTAETRGVMLFAIEHRSPPDALPAAVAVEAGAAVQRVDHVVIMTVEADAACELYRDRLGLRLAFDRTFAARGLRLMFFRVGGVTVELAATLGATSDAAAPDRFWGISWYVPDIDAARARLAGAGFDVSEVRPGHKQGTRVCTVRGETHGVATLCIGPSPP